MSRKSLVIISFFLLIILGAVLVYLWTFRKSDLSVGSEKADFKLTANELIQSFENNEELANAAYLDKVIVVTGSVSNISEDSLTVTVYLKEEGAISGILCSFNKSVVNTDKISIGKEVNVKGICSGYLLDVILNRCSLAE